MTGCTAGRRNRGVTMFPAEMTNGGAEEIVAVRITFDEGRVWF